MHRYSKKSILKTDIDFDEESDPLVYSLYEDTPSAFQDILHYKNIEKLHHFLTSNCTFTNYSSKVKIK